MGLSEVDLQGYEVPTARSTEDYRELYVSLCKRTTALQHANEQIYREFDILEQLDHPFDKYVEPDKLSVRSPLRKDWQQLDADELQDELRKIEQLHREVLSIHAELENAIDGLSKFSEKMAV